MRGVQTRFRTRQASGRKFLPGTRIPGSNLSQVSLTLQKDLPEFSTEHPIQQTLSLVTFGAPTPAMRDVIQAFRHVAVKAAL